MSWSRAHGDVACGRAPGTRRGNCPFVRASTATCPARTSCGSSERTNAATSAASCVLVVGADDPHRQRRPTGRTSPVVLAVGAEHLDAGGDDLRRAAVVHRQVDDLDAREARGDVEQQVGIGAVEAVDRLRRVADEEEVAAATVEQRHEALLDRVEVLGLVDEEVAEPVPHDLGPAPDRRGRRRTATGGRRSRRRRGAASAVGVRGERARRSASAARRCGGRRPARRRGVRIRRRSRAPRPTPPRRPSVATGMLPATSASSRCGSLAITGGRRSRSSQRCRSRARGRRCGTCPPRRGRAHRRDAVAGAARRPPRG